MSENENQRPRNLRQDALNLPNLITFMRILLIPLVLWLMSEATPRANFWAAFVYVFAAISDFIDGYIARKRGLVSVLGKFLDPLADKLLVMATLIFLVWMGRLDLFGVVAVIILIGRELSITALRTIAMSEGVVIAAGSGGKDKTALQMVAILLLILHHPYELDYFFVRGLTDLAAVGEVFLYLSVVFAITSAGDYFGLFVEAVEAKDRRLSADASTSSPSS